MKKLGEGFYGSVYLDANKEQIVKHHTWENMAKLESRCLSLLNQYCDFIKAPINLDGKVLTLVFQKGAAYHSDRAAQILKQDVAKHLGQLHDNSQEMFSPWLLDDKKEIAKNWPEHYLNWLKLLLTNLKNYTPNKITKIESLNTPKWAIENLETMIQKQPNLFACLLEDKPNLVHGDPSDDNTIVDNEKFIGFIDPFESGFYHFELDLLHVFQYDIEIIQAYQSQVKALKGDWKLRLAYMGFAMHLYHHFLTGWWDETYMQGRLDLVKRLEK